MVEFDLKELAKSIFKWLQKDQVKQFLLFLLEEYANMTETPMDDEVVKVIKDWAGRK